MLRALADCNNFFASCERALNPALIGVPIVVLSNNDGCVIARSSEAKLLGIPMGAPFFQVRRVCEAHSVKVFSSNFSVYGDFSERVMEVLAKQARDFESYSIDEAFLGFPDMPEADARALGHRIRNDVLSSTGISVSIGMGATKVLCKLANERAKGDPESGGVIVVPYSSEGREEFLKGVKTRDIWGVGKGLATRLRGHGILSAQDLAEADPAFIRRLAGVVGERIALELRGIACHEIIENPEARKSIMVSRSFGRPVSDFTDLSEAIATHAVRAAEKLRQENLATSNVTVFFGTNRFQKDSEQYGTSETEEIDFLTDDLGVIGAMAQRALKRVFREGYFYKKAGVILTELSSKDVVQETLPGLGTAVPSSRNRLMKAVDTINAKLGKEVVRPASTGFERKWKSKSEQLSENSQTQENILPKTNDVPKRRIRFHE
jgi:DNA polymerase V